MTAIDPELAQSSSIQPIPAPSDPLFAAFRAENASAAAFSTPERPELSGDLSSSEAFTRLARAGARRIGETTRAFLATDHPEAAHQLRVALRRHRSLLKLFRPALCESFRADQNARARALLQAVGPIRETDVLALETVAAAREAAPKAVRPAFDALTYQLGAEAAALRAEIRASAFGAAIGLYLTDLQEAIADGAWRAASTCAHPKHAPKERTARTAAKRALDRAEKKVAAWGKRIDALSIPERHEMRKDAKTLRYAVEFFGALFEEQGVAPYRRALKKLQLSFGALNDAAEAVKLRRLTSGADVDPALHEAVETVIAASEEAMERTFPEAADRWRALKKTPPFWSR